MPGSNPGAAGLVVSELPAVVTPASTDGFIVDQRWCEQKEENLVFVNPDEGMTDSYGRQTAHDSSVVHESNQTAHGNFWKKVA